MAMRIRKGDTVRILAGKERGKSGRVLSVLAQKDKVLVEKINIIKRHLKPSKKHAQGGIIDKEGAVHLSNVMLVCPKCGAAVRPEIQVLEDGKRQRVCRKCKEVVD